MTLASLGTFPQVRAPRVFDAQAKKSCAAAKLAVQDSRAAMLRSRRLIQKSKELLSAIGKRLQP